MCLLFFLRRQHAELVQHLSSALDTCGLCLDHKHHVVHHTVQL